ncbi:unnamed protein product [Brassica oleracea var. botrytis]|uniref:AMP-dependent synthetase/ligase domain-containing protein n=2 Tax=Brassica TaxID=3705 RepID=A0A3P6FSP0_BRAOL|nr:hypothetical protein HID58_081150 [Brassica napus]CAF2108755.1 unnamed protein product [Brassica napus]VDD56028.1 unnamed protein product [Brassica oleracea]
MSEINYNCSLRDNNLKVLQGYGLTETTAIVASMFTEEETERYRSSGLLSPNVEAKIVDQERVVSWGLIKLANSGSGVISKTKKATASTIDSEGWLKTGDVCYINSEEAVLLAHPEIADAAYPDTKAWQYPMAYIIRTAGINLSESEIIILVAKQVSPYKRICKVSHGFVFDPRESHWQDFKKRTYKAHNHKALAGSCVHQPYLRLHH